MSGYVVDTYTKKQKYIDDVKHKLQTILTRQDTTSRLDDDCKQKNKLLFSQVRFYLCRVVAPAFIWFLFYFIGLSSHDDDDDVHVVYSCRPKDMTETWTTFCFCVHLPAVPPKQSIDFCCCWLVVVGTSSTILLFFSPKHLNFSLLQFNLLDELVLILNRNRENLDEKSA